MVAAERGAELSVDGFELGRNEYSAHREAVADAFGYSDDVGAYAEPLVGEEATAASVAALYLVADKHCSVLLAELMQALGKLGCGQLDAANALNALQDDSAHVALAQLNLRVVRCFHGERRASVESLLTREDARATVVERSQLQGVLVGLGTAVDEKQLIVVVAAGGT